ncbi:bifunctional enoyl-CoA hydratase/phosphate acetyltransferase [Craurococcus roseus]|uniref:Bifunctional enoyl-CoA hydratase/phosphate acetyltransferase n=1 Tax=Craurococcus roseus TaxID=77585 RepID=A0ABP3QNC7_9PROT
MPTDAPDALIGLTAAELLPGRRASRTGRVPPRAFDLAAAVTGLPPFYPLDGPPTADEALLLGALVAELAAQELPGPGTVILASELRMFGAPAPDEEVTTALTVVPCGNRAAGEVALEAAVSGAGGRELAAGRLLVRPPRERVTIPHTERPAIVLQRHPHLARLLARAAEEEPLRTAVAWPCDRDSLLGPLEAAHRGFLRPVLVGPRSLIAAAAGAAGVDLDRAELVEADDPHAAAAAAAALCRDGRADALMKGSLHTDELMAAVVSRANGLRGRRRISHVFAFDVPAYPKPLFVTDAAINIAPDLMAKADIAQNAADLVRALGVLLPKIAVLAAVETVNPAMPATMDAAMLSKMAERGQITGALVDGPLAFDNAVSRAAAKTKRIESPVAGDADVLLAPDLEAGNMVAKQLSYLAGAESAGLVLGAQVPVILTSRADSVTARLASAALAQLVVSARRRGTAAG